MNIIGLPYGETQLVQKKMIHILCDMYRSTMPMLAYNIEHAYVEGAVSENSLYLYKRDTYYPKCLGEFYSVPIYKPFEEDFSFQQQMLQRVSEKLISEQICILSQFNLARHEDMFRPSGHRRWVAVPPTTAIKLQQAYNANITPEYIQMPIKFVVDIVYASIPHDSVQSLFAL